MLQTRVMVRNLRRSATSAGVQDSKSAPQNYQGMRLRQVFITPAKAQELLSKHNNYRSLDASKAAQYAAVMARGEWGAFPPICIGQAGDLHDGQHRCAAVVLCGKGQWFSVVSGIPADALDHYDNGRPRSPADALKKHYGKDLRTPARRLQSIILLTRYGCDIPVQLLNCDYPQLYEKYKSAIARFSGIFSKSHRHCPAVLAATFCRAWLRLSGDEVQRDALMEAALKYVRMEFDSARLGPLRMLCAWMCDANLCGRQDKADAYLRAANAIQAYLSRKTLKRLTPAKSDPFPLPDMK